MSELPPFNLAFPGPLRDQLVAAVLSGEKVATTGLVAEFEIDGEEIPKVGNRYALMNSAEKPIAVVETTDVRVIRLGDIDLQHAIDEGEGHTSLAEWRADHEKFWHGEENRKFMGDPNFRVDDTTMVVAERFRVVEVLADDDDEIDVD
jgi:uncharacterized protein YhfF